MDNTWSLLQAVVVFLGSRSFSHCSTVVKMCYVYFCEMSFCACMCARGRERESAGERGGWRRMRCSLPLSDLWWLAYCTLVCLKVVNWRLHASHPALLSGDLSSHCTLNGYYLSSKRSSDLSHLWSTTQIRGWGTHTSALIEYIFLDSFGEIRVVGDHIRRVVGNHLSQVCDTCTTNTRINGVCPSKNLHQCCCKFSVFWCYVMCTD